MKFNIYFRGTKTPDGKYPVIFESKIIDMGIEIVNDVRTYFNLSHNELPIDSILNNESCNVFTKLEIQLTEQQVLSCITVTGVNVFANFETVYVTVPEQYLTPYQTVVFEPSYEKQKFIFSKKRIKYVNIKPSILQNDIIEDWQKAKCPLKWGC